MASSYFICLQIPFHEELGPTSQLIEGKSERRGNVQDAMCFPFFSFMLALNVTHIDYFSLDVEGQELNVVKTIPFDRIDISVLSIEYVHTDKVKLKEYVESKGYDMVKMLDFTDRKNTQWSFDYIFVKRGFHP